MQSESPLVDLKQELTRQSMTLSAPVTTDTAAERGGEEPPRKKRAILAIKPSSSLAKVSKSPPSLWYALTCLSALLLDIKPLLHGELTFGIPNI